MRKYKPVKPVLLAFALLCLLASPLRAATEPAFFTLGEARLRVAGPEQHNRVNKSANLGLKLAPARYEGMIGHLLSVYSSPMGASITKLYNNYGGIFFVGPENKSWTGAELARLRDFLLSVKDGDTERAAVESEFLRQLLGEGVDFKISESKARKYYGQLKDVRLLHDGPDALAVSLRLKKKGEKEKYVTLSLSLVKDKLLGTVYYQVAPNRDERKRADGLTLKWQQALLAANV